MTGLPPNTAFAGWQRVKDGISSFNTISFVVNQILAGISTAMVVKVIRVTPGSGLLPGLVSVQPDVNQLDGLGKSVPHGTIFDLPFIRLQGGPNAVICDPAVNDSGLAIFAQRDISLVKRASSLAPLFGATPGNLIQNPGSRRRFDMADGIYVGGWGNAVPTQYVQFLSPNGIKIVDSNGNTIVMNSSGTTISDANGNVIALSSGGLHFTSGGITIGAVTHEHPDPQGGNTGAPIPGT